MSPSPLQPSAPAALPEQFGPYRILRPLGKGGMGSVYLARDTRLDRNVALKVCHLANDPQALERFRREAKAAASLRHPNLCPVHEFDVRDGIAYLTMAFIEGPTLAQWVAEHPLSQKQAAVLVARLALAMQEAHDKGVIHRDLKPANIALDEKGKPVILDFGLARLTAAHTKMTHTGAIFGTPAYMAPEQASGDPTAVGRAADQYSLGVILYELLCGDVPFTGTALILLYNTVNTPPVPPSQRNPGVGAALESICLRALAKKPEERYSSLKVFADELAKTARGLSRSGTLPRPVPPPLRTATAVTQPETSRTPTLPPTLPTSHERRPLRHKPGSGNALGLTLVVLLLAGLLVAGGYGIYRVWGKNRGDNGDSDSTEPDQKDRTASGNDPSKDKSTPPDPIKPRPDPKHPNDARTNSLGMTFVHLPKGTFYMGWDGPDKPGKATKIDADFEIAVHTVTQEQWAALMDGDDKFPSKFRRGGEYAKDVEKVSDEDLKRFPVENVSWDMVQTYIKKLNEKERGSGWTYRLPTEKEWEYACRGGATSEAECSFHFYFDKPTNELSAKLANFNCNFPFGNAPKEPDKYLARPTTVDDPAYPTNRLGLHHMHGNVWQWCADLYEEGGSVRVFRGGGWVSLGSCCRAAYRVGYAPSDRNSDLGFRLARVPSAK